MYILIDATDRLVLYLKLIAFKNYNIYLSFHILFTTRNMEKCAM